MDRIIPFGYPTIVGGASGGASVDPTPPSSDDPQPGPATLPYDLSNLILRSKGIHDNTDEFANVRVGKTATAAVVIYDTTIFENFVPVDLTGVKQISFVGPSFTSDDVIITADGVSIKDKLTYVGYMHATKTYLYVQDGNITLNTGGEYQYFSKENWNSYAKDKQIVLKYPVHITVYDNAGEIMQEYDTDLIA